MKEMNYEYQKRLQAAAACRYETPSFGPSDEVHSGSGCRDVLRQGLGEAAQARLVVRKVLDFPGPHRSSFWFAFLIHLDLSIQEKFTLSPGNNVRVVSYYRHDPWVAS